MICYRLPEKTEALLFDIDNTLYRNDAYCRLQVELLVERFALKKNISVEQARVLLSREKDRIREATGGNTSTGNLMSGLGISIRESAYWRDELFRPEDHLSYDRHLIKTIADLSDSYRLAAVTNNTVTVGRRTLAVLGVDGLFRTIVGLDTCFVSKPAKEPYEKAIELLSVSAERTISFGDRYEVDIAVPLAMGMGGCLIETMQDIYQLPVLLSAAATL